MGKEMGNTNSTSDQFQEEEGNTKAVQPAQGNPVQQPVVSVNDRILDGAVDGVNGGKGDHEEDEEESQQVHDESPKAGDETTGTPYIKLQPDVRPTEELEQLDSGLVEQQEPFEQEEAERLTSTLTAESPNPEVEETRSKDCNFQPHSLSEDSEQQNSDLVEEQEPFKQEEAEILNSTSTAESLETNPGSDGTRSKDHNLQSAELIEDTEELSSDLVEELEICKQEEAEILNCTTSTAVSTSHDEKHQNSYELVEAILNQNENSTSRIMSPPHSDESEPKKDHSSSITTESSSVDITGLENGEHLDDHTSQNPEGVLMPENIMKEELLANQPISPRVEIATEEESEDIVGNGNNHYQESENGSQIDCLIVPEYETNRSLDEAASEEQKTEVPKFGISTKVVSNKEQDSEVIKQQREASEIEHGGDETEEKEECEPESPSQEENGQFLDDYTSHYPERILIPENIMTHDQESKNGSQIDCSIVPEYESNGSLSEAASEEQKTEVPQLGIPTTGGSNKEQDSEVIKQQREASEIENSGEETEDIEEYEPESPPQEESKAPMQSEDSPQDSSSNSSWEFNPGNGHEFFADMAPTFVADRQELVVPFPIQLPAKSEETDQQLGRLSIGSVPDNFSLNFNMQKSPSFNLHLRRRSTEDYSDQTPLLRQYQDKNTILPSTKQTQTVESVRYDESVPAGEKVVQTLERCDSEKSLIVGRISEGDSNRSPRNNSRASKEESAALVSSKGKELKHYSRRRQTIFASCLCCTTTTAIN